MTAEIEPSLDRVPRSAKSEDLPPNHRALAEGETPGLWVVESSFCAPGGVPREAAEVCCAEKQHHSGNGREGT